MIETTRPLLTDLEAILVQACATAFALLCRVENNAYEAAVDRQYSRDTASGLKTWPCGRLAAALYAAGCGFWGEDDHTRSATQAELLEEYKRGMLPGEYSRRPGWPMVTEGEDVNPPILTRDIAWRAAMDAGNRLMRAGGRTAWNLEDSQAVAREFNRLYPYHCQGCGRIMEDDPGTGRLDCPVRCFERSGANP